MGEEGYHEEGSDEGCHEGEEGEQRDEEGGDEEEGHEEGQGDRGGMREEQWGRFEEALADQILACRCGLDCRARPGSFGGWMLHDRLGQLVCTWSGLFRSGAPFHREARCVPAALVS